VEAGGAGGVGFTDGGAGVANSITGSSVTYAGGGGGSPSGSGGSGVGGNGGGSNQGGGAGAENTGSGGGGSGGGGAYATNGGLGASGVVIVAYQNTFKPLTVGPGLTYDEPTRSGYYVYRFTAGTGNVSWA